MYTYCPWYIDNLGSDPPRFITYPGVMHNMYTISNSGVVTNIVNNFKVSQFVNHLYLKCNLMTLDRNQIQCPVHRLVAWEWVLDNRNFNLHVNHIDGNKLNNNYWNLEWVTPNENMQHAIQAGLIDFEKIAKERVFPEHINQGEDHGMSKLTNDEVHMICKMLEDPNVRYEEVLQKINYKVDAGVLKGIAHGRSWTHISCNYSPVSRDQFGENSPNHKLTGAEVHMICKMLEDEKTTYEDIAKQFPHVSIHTIIDIAHGNTWTDISKQYNIPFRYYERPVGVDHHNSKLTEEDVHKICQLLEEGGHTYEEIANMIGNKVKKDTIFRIKKGDQWTHISCNYNFNKNK